MAVTRNVPCPCGSGRKYKQCCQPVDALVHLHDQAQAALDADDQMRGRLAAGAARTGSVRESGLWLVVCEAQVELGDPESAEAALTEAIRIDPHVANQGWTMAAMWIRYGRPERAERWLADMKTGDWPKYLRGLRHWVAGDHAGAVKVWRALLVRKPDPRFLDQTWVEAQILGGDLTRALAHLSEHTRNLPTHGDAFWYLSLVDSLLGDDQGAAAAAAVLAERHPDLPTSHQRWFGELARLRASDVH